MKGIILIIVGIMFLTVGFTAHAQNMLYNPSHVAYDTISNRYIVSNWGNGKIIAIDHDGTQTELVSGLGHAIAEHISGDTLFVSTGVYIKAYSLPYCALLWSELIENSQYLYALATDTSGYLYMSDVNTSTGAGKLMRMLVSDRTSEVIVSTGLPSYPEDMIFDIINNRMLIASYANNAPIIALDVVTHGITTVRVTPFGYSNGLVMDNDGNLYINCWPEDAVYKYESGLGGSPIKMFTGFTGVASPGYNPEDDVLAVPSFHGHRVDFFGLADNDADNLLAYEDNCPEMFNPDQNDSDDDDVGDLCDNCPDESNWDQQDFDDDGAGDICDGCPDIYDPEQEDPDEDGVNSICDNCPRHYNPWQQDSDDDSIGDICDFVCGDFDGDLNINILDIVYLINSIYKDGLPPIPPDRMDVNNDLLVNILDVVYLLNHKYKDGPGPECTA